MNDFTKEELKNMGFYLTNHVPIIFNDGEEATFMDLRKKIQSMIDNYCEHDCKDTIFIRTVTACSKCDYPVGAYRK